MTDPTPFETFGANTRKILRRRIPWLGRGDLEHTAKLLEHEANRFSLAERTTLTAAGKRERALADEYARDLAEEKDRYAARLGEVIAERNQAEASLEVALSAARNRDRQIDALTAQGNLLRAAHDEAGVTALRAENTELSRQIAALREECTDAAELVAFWRTEAQKADADRTALREQLAAISVPSAPFPPAELSGEVPGA